MLLRLAKENTTGKMKTGKKILCLIQQLSLQVELVVMHIGVKKDLQYPLNFYESPKFCCGCDGLIDCLL